MKRYCPRDKKRYKEENLPCIMGCNYRGQCNLSITKGFKHKSDDVPSDMNDLLKTMRLM